MQRKGTKPMSILKGHKIEKGISFQLKDGFIHIKQTAPFQGEIQVPLGETEFLIGSLRQILEELRSQSSAKKK
jgi:hypothetical protein